MGTLREWIGRLRGDRRARTTRAMRRVAARMNALHAGRGGRREVFYNEATGRLERT